jgi:hypothetical protein
MAAALSSNCTAVVVKKREAERAAQRKRETEFKDSLARASRDVWAVKRRLICLAATNAIAPLSLR